MKQGDYSTELIAIEEGTADVIQGGKKIASLREGDLIGEMGLLEREPRNADVIATSPMRLLKLTHWEIRRMSEDTVERIKQIDRGAPQAGVADPAHATPATDVPRAGAVTVLIRCRPPNPRTAAPGSGGTRFVGASLAVIREKRSSRAPARQLTPQAQAPMQGRTRGERTCPLSAAFAPRMCNARSPAAADAARAERDHAMGRIGAAALLLAGRCSCPRGRGRARRRGGRRGRRSRRRAAAGSSTATASGSVFTRTLRRRPRRRRADAAGVAERGRLRACP